MSSLNSPELITPQHRQRKAIIYIRQSSPHQVLTNQESLRLQYALQQHALELGWRVEDIEVIDSDLGITGKSARPRQGFQELVARVGLGQVGIILSIEVQRLSRNCSDWYPLLDVCAFRGCLIADNDGIYDPASPNGRLLLGLKGQLSELELHTIRARMTAGLLNKAQRGELALLLPVGLVRDAAQRVRKDPNQEVQARIALVFSTFLEVRTASKVLDFFNAQHLELPRHDRFGDIVWKKPSVAALLSILKNPAYAGAFVYGKTRTVHLDLTNPRGQQRKVPLEEWKIRVNDVYPAYIEWETYLKIRAILADNYAEYARNQSRGIPRAGATLLHGITYCGECGHKMQVQYKHGSRYLCNGLRQAYHVPVCQNLPADPIDARVVEAFFEALSPVELDVYSRTLEAEAKIATQVETAHQQHLERLRYEAALTQRQFNRVDPDNRLVAAELEKRWEEALATLKQAEENYAELRQTQTKPQAVQLSEELKQAFRAVCQHLPQLWEQGVIDQVRKKALLRSLIDKVVIRQQAVDSMAVRIVWKGGAVSELPVEKTVKRMKDLRGSAEMERLIVERSEAGRRDEEIAEELNVRGYRSPMADKVLTSTVRGIRLRHNILQVKHQSHPRKVAGYLTVTQLAKALDMEVHWIYDRIHKGTIAIEKNERGMYLFPDEPETLKNFKGLYDGKFQKLDYRRGHQHV